MTYGGVLVFQKYIQYILARHKFQNSETLIWFALVLSLLFEDYLKIIAFFKIKLRQFFRWINEGDCISITIKQQRNALTSHGCSLSPVICKIQYDREKSLRINRVCFFYFDWSEIILLASGLFETCATKLKNTVSLSGNESPSQSQDHHCNCKCTGHSEVVSTLTML